MSSPSPPEVFHNRNKTIRLWFCRDSFDIQIYLIISCQA
uniref:Uncharacterized protein n=1 Tax=Rhizophora mucronata TaxID=61149 RepID=A0A2P2JRU3_RHIMU